MRRERPALELLLLAVRISIRAGFGLARATLVLWLRLPPRARVGSVLATLVVVSGVVGNVSTSASAALHGLAVLVLAFVGLGIIFRAPFRRRPF